MFDKPTVFILGAGASWHYGYPTGEELVKMVIERSAFLGNFCRESPDAGNTFLPEYVKRRVTGTSPHPVNLNEAWQSVSQECKDLEMRLKQVNPPVIDYFLGQNPELQEIGKLIIALVILECESRYLRKRGNINRVKHLENSPLRSERRMAEDVIDTQYNDNWVRFVLYHLVSNCNTSGDLLANEVTFITFNYDISFEYKLYSGLSHIERFQSEHVDGFFKDDRVLHIYGKIKDCPPLETHSLGLDAIPFGGKMPGNYNSDSRRFHMDCQKLLDSAYQSSLGLKVISDDKGQDTHVIEQASYAVQKAMYVYILGYGFDENNSKRLGLNIHLQARYGSYPRVFFTNLEDRNSVNKKASRLFSGSPENFLPPKSIYEPFVPGSARDSTDKVGTGYFEKSTRNVYDALERDFEL